MGFPRLTIIAVDTAREIDLLRPIHRMDFLANSEIHMVHMLRKMDYGDGLSFNVNFPLDQDLEAIKTAVISKMRAMAPEVIPYQYAGKVIFDCLIGLDPKQDFAKYVNEVEADLIIIASRATHGLFESSFAYYVSRHCRSNVLVIKSQEE
jgi:nucleotide-binding universal stress UspA family protein